MASSERAEERIEHKRSQKERTCPDCGVGIIGGHMNRHRNSKVCWVRMTEQIERRLDHAEGK